MVLEAFIMLIIVKKISSLQLFITICANVLISPPNVYPIIYNVEYA